MQLPLRTIGDWVALQVAGVQGRCARLVDLGKGSLILSIVEANAAVASWMQWLLFLTLASTRLATSVGDDATSWVADFGLAREPAVPATGQVTFSRFAPLQAATVPATAAVRTADLSKTFVVTIDRANPLWSEAAGGYVIPAGSNSGTVPVVAAMPGAAGNVQAGAVSLVSSSIVGVDTVVNAAGFADGLDEETDAALKARFPLYLASLSKATLVAIEAAVASVQQGLTYHVAANQDEGGAFRPGHFVVVVDDGSGTPSDALKSRVYAAVDAVRALAETFSIQSPAVLHVDIALTLTVGAGAVRSTLLAPVAQAITAFVNGLSVGQVLPYSRLAVVVYGASPAILNVSHLVINGFAGDVAPAANAVVKVRTCTVS